MNATDEDEFGELLGLPSNVGTTPLTHAPSNPKNTSSLTEPDDLYNELYGTSSNPQTSASFANTGVQYNAFFGNVEKQNSLQSSISITSQRGSELAHEPLFPDVDEAKIQPTVGLGGSLQQRQVTTETEFSIVVDPSGLDSRFTSQNNGPMAGWVIPNQHNRRESHPQRPTQSNFQPSTPGIRPPTGTNVGPLHPRSAPTTNNSRASRIPAHCNADLDPEFPSRAAPDQALKLPGQTRVTPDEYKEFLGLGHGEIFNLDLDRVVDPPWRLPGAESSDFFNYGMDEAGWKEYCKKIEFHRQEFSMKKKIQTYESTSLSFQQDPDLPPEVAAAIAAETGPRTGGGGGNEVIKALPIPVFQGLDDYSMRNRRGRDFRRPEVRFDSEVILELVGGLETSNAVNADYGEDYVALFGPGENLQRVSEEQDNSQVIEDQPRLAIKKEEVLSASGEETPGTKEDTSAMFGDEDFNPSPYEGVQPGELAMGMDPTTDGQGQQSSWSVQRPPGSVLGSRGGPPRPDFNRNFDFYSPRPGLWRPPPAGFQQGPRGWRPRGGVHVGNPEFWEPGRGPFRGRGGGGGRHWSGHPHPYGRRGGRQGPLHRYEDYSIRPGVPWSRPEDHGKPISLDSDHSKPGMEDVKDRGGVWYKEQGEDKHYYDRSRRREDLEDRSYSTTATTRFRSRDHEQDYIRSDRNLASIGRDRTTRHEDYEDRYREKRRPMKSSDRRSSRSSKEKLRVREKEEKRSRRHETSSDSGSDRGTGHYRNRS